MRELQKLLAYAIDEFRESNVRSVGGWTEKVVLSPKSNLGARGTCDVKDEFKFSSRDSGEFKLISKK